MLYDLEDGCYLFLYDQEKDSSSTHDYLQDSIATAKEMARLDFGVEENEWSEIPDPLPSCQHDWISPVRVTGRLEGKPKWGVYEVLQDGEWKPI